MAGRFVLWIVLSLVLGCAGVILAARAGVPLLFPYGIVLPEGWLLAVVLSLLLAWALGLLPGSGGQWAATVTTAAFMAVIAANPVLVLYGAAYTCAVENGLGGHCIFL